MNKNFINFIIFFLVLSLFIGTTLEYSHGYSIIGFLFFTMAIILLFRIKIDKKQNIKSKFYIIAGLSLIIFDIVHNYTAKDPIKTLDSMTLLLGASLIARSVNNEQARKVGTFGTYMSLSFIALYVTFYNILSESLYKFDHYAVTYPSAYIVKTMGVPLDITDPRTIKISGIKDLTLEIGGPCSGLYSMFLLISLVIGYSITESIRDMRNIVLMATIAAIVAYIANLSRVSIILFIAYLYGYNAMMLIHVHLGWIIFTVVSITIFYTLSKIGPSLRSRGL